MKSHPAPSFYRHTGASGGAREAPETFEALPTSGGPWSEGAQHGGPPAALLTRALEGVDEGTPRVLGRITLDLLGPVPVGPLSTSTRVLRAGRSVSLREAVLHDDVAGRPVVVARAWCYPVRDDGPGDLGEPLPHTPTDGVDRDPPAGWRRGYLDAVEWRFVEGAVTEPGPATVWMRPRVDLVEGESASPLQRLMSLVDSANGVAAALDPAVWGFLNTDLTVHVVREPVGEWLCLSARTTLGPGATGVAAAEVHDLHGLVARSAQSLLVTRWR